MRADRWPNTNMAISPVEYSNVLVFISPPGRVILFAAKGSARFDICSPALMLPLVLAHRNRLDVGSCADKIPVLDSISAAQFAAADRRTRDRSLACPPAAEEDRWLIHLPDRVVGDCCARCPFCV